MCPVTIATLAISMGAISGAAGATTMAAVAAASAAGTLTGAAATAMTIASTVSAIGSVAMMAGGIYQAISSSSNQKRQIREKYRQQEQQNKLASEALRRDFEQANIQKVENAQKAASQKEEIKLATKVETAEVRNSAGEAGISGLSIDNLLDSITREGLYDSTTISTNLAMNVAQINRNSQASQLRYGGRVDNTQYFMQDNTGQIISAIGGGIRGATG